MTNKVWFYAIWLLMKFTHFILGLSLMALSFSPRANAWIYPMLEDANTQVFLLRFPKVHFALRREISRRARVSIDTVTYIRSAKPGVGLPALEEMREARSRGVKERHIYNTVSSLIEDPTNRALDYLADDRLPGDVKVIALSPYQYLKAGLHPLDFVHEKIYIADAGTPNESVIICGRNDSELTLKDIDFGILMRPIDPSKPYLGSQIKEAFESLYETTARISPPVGPKRVNPRAIPLHLQADPIVPSTAAERELFTQIDQMMKRPVDLTAPLRDFELRPKKGQLLTNETIAYLRTGVWGKTFGARETLRSDIYDAMAPVIANGRRIRAAMMSVFLDKNIKDAYKQALLNGADIDLFSNARSAHVTQVPLGLPYDLSLQDMHELISAPGPGSFRISLLEADEIAKAKEETLRQFQYMHFKGAVVDNHVYLGSDNVNRTGRVSSSELMLHLEDEDSANKVGAVMDANGEVFRRYSCEDILKGLNNVSVIRRGMNRVMMSLY